MYILVISISASISTVTKGINRFLLKIIFTIEEESLVGLNRLLQINNAIQNLYAVLIFIFLFILNNYLRLKVC